MTATAVAALAAALVVGGTAPGRGRLRAMHPSSRAPATPEQVHRGWTATGGIAVAAAVWAVVGGIGGVLLGVSAGVVAALGVHRLLRPGSAGRTDPVDLAAAWELLAVCLASGLPLPAALAAATEGLPGEAGAQLRKVAGLLALGADPVQAWREVSAAELAVFARAAARSAGTGSTLAAVARAQAERVRVELTDEAHARAQRAAVTIAGPLGLCHLPAFLVLGIAPVVIGLVGEVWVRWA